MSSVAELQEAITRAGDRVRELKLSKSPFETELAELKDLKSKLASLQPSDSSSGAASSSKPKGAGAGANVSASAGKKGKARAFELKVPKGTKDHHPHEMRLRQQIFSAITDIFDKHGGVTIDTPVFELKEILSGKYGEDSKLIYDLADQGGEICSLRYDLTVPFARFLAMNRDYQNIKRYHIAKVYRRDNPAMTKGRMREFYQCDFDIAGQYDRMMPDAEILRIACEVLEALKIGEFTIKLNHRCLLDGIFALCGVPDDKIRSISSAVDKLDKLPWDEVRREMTVDKGLDGQVADRIGSYVKLKGGRDLLDKLKQDGALTANKRAAEGLADMALLFDYVDVYGILDKLSFDLSLARGLDYYTGLIYEVVVEGSAPPTLAAATAAPALAPRPNGVAPASADAEADLDESQVGVGSIAAGGRYDELVGMFSPNNSKIPCVGISFGVERIFSILRQRLEASSAAGARAAKDVDVFVIGVGDVKPADRMRLAVELWDAGLSAEFLYKVKPKLGPQFEAVDRDSIPIAVIVGPDELRQSQVRIKVQRSSGASSDDQGNGTLVTRSEMVPFIRQRLSQR